MSQVCVSPRAYLGKVVEWETGKLGLGLILGAFVGLLGRKEGGGRTGRGGLGGGC